MFLNSNNNELETLRSIFKSQIVSSFMLLYIKNIKKNYKLNASATRNVEKMLKGFLYNYCNYNEKWEQAQMGRKY